MKSVQKAPTRPKTKPVRPFPCALRGGAEALRIPSTVPLPAGENETETGARRRWKTGTREDQAWVRVSVQAGFLLFCLLLGLEFHRFVASLAHPLDHPAAPRPASVEGFLPISSLMSLIYLIRTGEASGVHPAGLVIFSMTVLSVVFLRRGFCSWVCPIGTLCEYAHRAGSKILGRNLSLPLWPDRLLRLVKYGLLGFFLYSILKMSPQGLREFLDGPYNRIADVKMYLFFAPISLTALSVVLGLTLLSFFVKNFWCRYLCPYGALLGLLSWTSPAGIRREGAFCTRCGRCDKACPNRIRISGKRFVRSEECTACLQCTQTCPERGALAFGLSQRRLRLKEEVFAMLVILAFVFLPRLFSAAGYWHTDTPPMMYKALYRMHHEIDHPR